MPKTGIRFAYRFVRSALAQQLPGWFVWTGPQTTTTRREREVNVMGRRVNVSRLTRRWCVLLDREQQEPAPAGESDEWLTGYRAGLCVARTLIRKG
jgi:hypothetical protein